jgi:hypothetical protein
VDKICGVLEKFSQSGLEGGSGDLTGKGKKIIRA